MNNRIDKNRKKTLWFTVITTLCLVIVTLSITTGCKEKTSPTNENILIGEWDCIKLAYITENKTISNVTALSTGHLVIHNNTEDLWKFFCGRNEYRCEYSIAGNFINFTTVAAITYAMPTQEETEIMSALEHTHSFNIKNNKLMFYFTGIENQNVLILKKR